MMFVLGVIAGLAIALLVLLTTVYLSFTAYSPSKLLRKTEVVFQRKGTVYTPDEGKEQAEAILKKNAERGLDTPLEELQ